MQLTALLLSTAAGFASAQIVFNNTTDSYICPATGGNFCAEPSLKINIIIRCTGTAGQPGNCNDNLAGVPPAGLKSNALCYQSSSTAANAACSLNGIVYPETGGAPFSINGTNTTTTTNGSTSGSTRNPSLTASAVISTDYVIAAAPSVPLSVLLMAMVTTVVAPYPTPTLINGTKGLIIVSATSGVPKPTETFVGGAGALEAGAWVLRAGLVAAAVFL
ncbi:hypothetical protein OEA41_000721 [Lepraria neglecta]|uniref:Uncharacterized protein n=1 Tax=Lepraria neglecta TaxID=209136 RepID=A0AAE0DPP9_9LECA|nr:hypothetical protein OEA41_000721 [Lepraria neglecta]